MRVSEVVPVKFVNNRMLILDQSRLPGEEKYLEMNTKEDIFVAIKKLKVRGAPAIGVAAAYGLFVSVRDSEALKLDEFKDEVHNVADYIVKARPTAVNLSWALNRMKERLDGFDGDVMEAKQLLLEEAEKIRVEDEHSCRKMGEYGLTLLKRGMLYVWGQLLPAKDAAEVFDITEQEAIEFFEELAAEYEQEGRGILIRRVNDSFQFVTRADNGEFVRRLCTPVKIKKLSQAALEVLAIIAYRQPVTKGEIDSIRGIKSDRVMEGLIKKELVRELGRSDAVGRPLLYGTTDEFLKNFGFESLKDLPEIENIEGIIDMDDTEEADDDSRQIAIEMEGENVRNN